MQRPIPKIISAITETPMTNNNASALLTII